MAFSTGLRALLQVMPWAPAAVGAARRASTMVPTADGMDTVTARRRLGPIMQDPPLSGITCRPGTGRDPDAAWLSQAAPRRPPGAGPRGQDGEGSSAR